MTRIFSSPFFLPLAPGIRTPSVNPPLTEAIIPPVTPQTISPSQTITNNNGGWAGSSKSTTQGSTNNNGIKTLAEQQANPPKPGTVENPTEVPESLLAQNGSWVPNPLLVAKAKAPKTIIDNSGRVIPNPALNYIAAKTATTSQQNLPAFVVGVDGRWIPNPNIKSDSSKTVDRSPTAQGSDIDILLPSGKVYTKAGDQYSLAELVQGSIDKNDKSGNTIISYRVAIRDAATGGVGKGALVDADGLSLRAELDGTYSISADDFSKIRYASRSDDGTDQLIIAAASGTTLAKDGSKVIRAYSRPIEIDFVNGATRSANGNLALVKFQKDDDAPSQLAQQAKIFSLTSVAKQPEVTVKNSDVSLKTGTTLRLSELVQVKLPEGVTDQKLSRFVIAFSEPNFASIYSSKGEKIEPDANGLMSLTADEFEFSQIKIDNNNLGAKASLSLSAVSTKALKDSTAPATVYSVPVKIDLTVDSRNSQAIAGVARDAPLPIGVPPVVDGYGYLTLKAAINKNSNQNENAFVSTIGTVEVGEGDRVILGDLIQTTKAKSSNSFVDFYALALSNPSSGNPSSAKLFLDERLILPDVNGLYKLSTDQLARIQLDPGQKGEATEVLISAINKVLPTNSFKSIDYYSPLASLTVAVTGANSLNGAKAITSAAGKSDSFKQVATLSQIGLAKKPEQAITLTTVGSFNALTGDRILVGNLLTATNPTIGEISNYLVALRDSVTGDGNNPSGRLLLDDRIVGGAGVDPADLKTSFTPLELDRLVYEFNGRADDFIFTAASQNYDGKGNKLGLVYSPAVSITAAPSYDGLRSLNITEAVRPPAPDPFFGIAKLAEVFKGVANSDRGQVSTVGNFESAAAASFRLSDLIKARSPKDGKIDSYHLAIRPGQNNPLGSVSGRLILDGEVVAGAGFVATAKLDREKTSFTEDEWSRLRYEAGEQGTRDDFIVSTSSKKYTDRGIQLSSVYSPAVQFNNQVTGANSLSVAGLATYSDPDKLDGFSKVARLSEIYKGDKIALRPELTTRIVGDDAGIDGANLISLNSVGEQLAGSNSLVVSTIEGLKIGQGVISSYLPDHSFITSIDAVTKTIGFSAPFTKKVLDGASFLFTDRPDNFFTANSLKGGLIKDVKLKSDAAVGDLILQLSSVIGLQPGQGLTGSLIQAGTTILAVDLLADTITLSKPLQVSALSFENYRLAADAAQDDFDLRFVSLAGLEVGQLVRSSLLPDGTRITNLDRDNNIVTLSNGLRHGTVAGEKFAVYSPTALLAESSISIRGIDPYRSSGTIVGRSTSTVRIDPTLSSSFEFSKLSTDSSKTITTFVSPNRNIYASQLLLLNNQGIGGYQTSDRGSTSRLISLSSQVNRPIETGLPSSKLDFAAPTAFLPYNRFIP